MPRALTPVGLVGRLVEAGVVPADAPSERRGTVREWSDRGLRFSLLVWRPSGPRSAELLCWRVFVRPVGPIGEPFEQGGLDAWVALGPPVDEIEASSLVVEQVAADVRAAVGFVADVADYVRVLLVEEGLVRDGVVTWPQQGYPARLVKARELAKEIGRPDLVAEVDAVLDSGLRVSVSPVLAEDVRVAADDWVRILSKQSGRPIAL